MKSQIILTAFIIASWQLGTFFVYGELYFKKGAPHVKLADGDLLNGIVKFSRNGRPYSSFTGIPYARVQRFQEPIENPTWEGVFSASKPGPMCSQLPAFGMEGVPLGEEDCLNMNVYVPMNNTGYGKKGFPVMLWLHGAFQTFDGDPGLNPNYANIKLHMNLPSETSMELCIPGAFTFGGGFGYSSKFMMDEDVILITINYRLGVFGFLSTGDSVIPGNNGLKDMVVALKWVQKHIRQFGGNPGSVTIFGESAGGAAVHYLLLSPVAKGLFHRAISQSGTALGLWAHDPNPKQVAIELATYLKCPTTASEPSGITSDEILTCLKGVPTDELNKAQLVFRKSWPLNRRTFNFVPTIEPIDPVPNLTPFLSEHPMSILANKEKNLTEIPWMVGATEDEGAAMYAGIVISKPELLKEINLEWDNIAPSLFDYGKYLGKDEQAQISQKLKQFYFGEKEIGNETRTALVNIFSDQVILHGIYRSALETALRGKRNPVYLYQYAYKGPISVMGMSFQLKGIPELELVGHADELVHLFDFGITTPGTDMIKPGTPDEEFSKNLVRLWAKFAIHGEPKHYWGNATFNEWKYITKREQVGLDALRWFRIDANPGSYDIHHSVIERMQLWDAIWKDHINPLVMSNNNTKPANSRATQKNETATGKTEL